jgi:hypothetical protein
VVVRPVGLALTPPLLMYAWQYGGGGRRSLGWLCLCLPLAMAGLAAFMAYCHWRFDDPIAFARDRDELWRLRPRVPPLEKLGRLLILEPVWGVFVPTSSAFWGSFLKPEESLFNTHLAGPFYFLAALALLVWGARSGRLNRYEVALAAGLLLIPYGMTAHESALVSMARYVSVVAPLYPFVGCLLARAPAYCLGVAAGVVGFYLAAFAALFSQGHWVI